MWRPTARRAPCASCRVLPTPLPARGRSRPANFRSTPIVGPNRYMAFTDNVYLHESFCRIVCLQRSFTSAFFKKSFLGKRSWMRLNVHGQRRLLLFLLPPCPCRRVRTLNSTNITDRFLQAALCLNVSNRMWHSIARIYSWRCITRQCWELHRQFQLIVGKLTNFQ